MLGSDRVLAIANFDVLLVSDSIDIRAKLGLLPQKCNVLAVMQNEQWCGFYGSGRVASRAEFITVSIRYGKVCVKECFGKDAETSTRAACALRSVT